jgi:hypothetical protein
LTNDKYTAMLKLITYIMKLGNEWDKYLLSEAYRELRDGATQHAQE